MSYATVLRVRNDGLKAAFADAVFEVSESEQKFKMKNLKLKIAALVLAAITPVGSYAVTIINWSSTLLVGQVAPGTSTATADNAAYVDSLVDRSHSINPSPYDLSGNAYTLFNTQAGTLKYVDLSQSVFTGAVGGDNLVPNVTGYEYLVVKYDGANGEAYVINIRGITGDVQVPATDPRKNTHNRYLLFNDITPGTRVPDGGSTAILLGLGIVGAGLLRRRNQDTQS
jgi:hypothetical protein